VSEADCVRRFRAKAPGHAAGWCGAENMAVTKRVLRNLLGVKLAALELQEPSGKVARRIFSVGTPGDPADIRYFPHVDEAETYFFEQVRKVNGDPLDAFAASDFLDMRARTHRV
jgi:hypothetical protein